MKIWQAALATSAAPFYLPPFYKQPGNADYIDGAVYANCPAKVAIEEVGKLWPNEGTSLDILLSLGTGRQTKKKPKIPKAIRYGVFIPILHMFERQMDTERIWDDIMRNSPIKDRLHRLNPDVRGQSGHYVDINHHQELQHLLDSVGDWTKTSGAAHIGQISRVLIASLFFFEPDPKHLPKEGATLRGSVRCRLRHESEAIRVLIENRVMGFWYTTVTKTEVSQLQGLADSRWRPIRDNLRGKIRATEMIVEEGSTRNFRLNFHFPPQPDSASAPYQVLAVQLDKGLERIPISGFPATLEELDRRSKAQWLQ